MNFEKERDTAVLLRLSAVNNAIPRSGETTNKPVWSRINGALKSAFLHGGSVDLTRFDDGRAIAWLDMSALPGKFRLILNVENQDPKEGLYEWWEPGDAPFRGVVRFGDDDWDARTVCSDLAVAQTVFLEFFETGELSQGISSMLSVWSRRP